MDSGQLKALGGRERRALGVGRGGACRSLGAPGRIRGGQAVPQPAAGMGRPGVGLPLGVVVKCHAHISRAARVTAAW